MAFRTDRYVSIVICCATLTFSAHALAIEPDMARPLTLAMAEALMRQQSPQLQLSTLAVAAARADVATAGEIPNPQLSFNSSSIDYRAGIGSGSPWDKRADSILRLDQPIERGKKKLLRQRAAAMGEQASLAESVDSLRTENLRLANAYYDLKYAQEAERVAENIEALQSQSLDAAKLRLATGDIATVDVARLEIESARAIADLTAAHTATAAARFALAQVIGLSDADAHVSASDDWPALVDTPGSMTNIEQRADVRAARAHDEEALATLESVRAQRTRDITVGVQFEHNPTLAPGNPDSVGIGFSVPLFIGNHYAGEIQRAAIDRRIATENLRASVINASRCGFLNSAWATHNA